MKRKVEFEVGSSLSQKSFSNALVCLDNTSTYVENRNKSLHTVQTACPSEPSSPTVLSPHFRSSNCHLCMSSLIPRPSNWSEAVHITMCCLNRNTPKASIYTPNSSLSTSAVQPTSLVPESSPNLFKCASPFSETSTVVPLCIHKSVNDANCIQFWTVQGDIIPFILAHWAFLVSDNPNFVEKYPERAPTMEDVLLTETVYSVLEQNPDKYRKVSFVNPSGGWCLISDDLIITNACSQKNKLQMPPLESLQVVSEHGEIPRSESIEWRVREALRNLQDLDSDGLAQENKVTLEKEIERLKNELELFVEEKQQWNHCNEEAKKDNASLLGLEKGESLNLDQSSMNVDAPVKPMASSSGSYFEEEVKKLLCRTLNGRVDMYDSIKQRRSSVKAHCDDPLNQSASSLLQSSYLPLEKSRRKEYKRRKSTLSSLRLAGTDQVSIANDSDDLISSSESISCDRNSSAPSGYFDKKTGRYDVQSKKNIDDGAQNREINNGDNHDSNGRQSSFPIGNDYANNNSKKNGILTENDTKKHSAFNGCSSDVRSSLKRLKQSKSPYASSLLCPTKSTTKPLNHKIKQNLSSSNEDEEVANSTSGLLMFPNSRKEILAVDKSFPLSTECSPLLNGAEEKAKEKVSVSRKPKKNESIWDEANKFLLQKSSGNRRQTLSSMCAGLVDGSAKLNVAVQFAERLEKEKEEIRHAELMVLRESQREAKLDESRLIMRHIYQQESSKDHDRKRKYSYIDKKLKPGYSLIIFKKKNFLKELRLLAQQKGIEIYNASVVSKEKIEELKETFQERRKMKANKPLKRLFRE